MHDPEEDSLLHSKHHKRHTHHGPGAKRQSDCILVDDPDFQKRLQKGQGAMRKLIQVTIICVLFMIAEFIGGWISNSVAIMTDAAHMLSDSLAFVISIFSICAAKWRPDQTHSFGFHRTEVLGALVSILTIWVLVFWLIVEAVERVDQCLHGKKFELNATVMLITSIVSLICNVLNLIVLGHGCSSAEDDILANLTSVFRPHGNHNCGHEGCTHHHDHSHHDHDHDHSHHHEEHNHGHHGHAHKHEAHGHSHHEIKKLGDVELAHVEKKHDHGHSHHDHKAHGHSHDHAHEHHSHDHEQQSAGPHKHEVHSHAHHDHKAQVSKHAHGHKHDSHGHQHHDHKDHGHKKHQHHDHGHHHEGGESHYDELSLDSPASHDHGHKHHGDHSHSHDHHDHGHHQEHKHGGHDHHAHSHHDDHGHSHHHEHDDHDHDHHSEPLNINVQAAIVHLIGDVLQSVGVIIAAIVICYKPNWIIIDPICTFLFSILVMFTTVPTFRQCMGILMEQTPPEVRTDLIRGDILALDAVARIDDFHCWALAGDKYFLTAHIKLKKAVSNDSESTSTEHEEGCALTLVQDVHAKCLKIAKKNNICHSTFQIL